MQLSEKAIETFKKEKSEHDFGTALEMHAYASFLLACIKNNFGDSNSVAECNGEKGLTTVSGVSSECDIDWSLILSEISVAKKVAVKVFFFF